MPEAYNVFEFIKDDDERAKAIEAYNAQLAEVTASVDTKIEEAVTGLQNKNQELLGEKKDIAAKLAKFADITDPVKALEALKFINENEDAQLIRDGKVNELIEKKTSAMRIDHNNTIKELADKLEDVSKGKDNYKGLYQTKIMDDAMRAVSVQAGVRAEAISDVLLRAKSIFSLDKEGSVEARDSKGNLKKNEGGDVVTPAVWLEDLKASSPHYWPSSEGAGAVGGNIAGDADTTAKLAEYAKRGEMKKYRALRASMGK